MDTGELAIGTRVRYPRTGTAGTVVRIEQQSGTLFAEIDTTGLLYRADQLIPVTSQKGKEKKKQADDLEQLKKEREFLSSEAFQEAVAHTDQSCEGGG